MALLDYNRQTSLNVIPEKDFQELILGTFNSVAEVLGRSLGPLGSTTTILDGMYTSATKDGWTIFSHLHPGNIYKAMIFNLIKGPCSKLNNTVGDGTTTAIVLTSLLFRAYSEKREELKQLYGLPREFNRTWDDVVENICELVSSYARELPRHSVYDVAYVASNGNSEIARNMQNIYDEAIAPVVKLRSSPTNQCYVEAIKGYEFPAELTDEAYVKNEDLSAVYENLRVLLFDFKVEADIFEHIIVPINEAYRVMGTKLLVIAPAYDELLANTTMKKYANLEWQRNDHQLNLIVSQYRYAKLSDHQSEDLAVLLGCEIIDRYGATAMRTQIEEMEESGELFDKLEELTGDIELLPFDFRKHIGVAPTARLSIGNGSTFSGFDTSHNSRYDEEMARAIALRDEVMARTEADRQNFSIELSKANARIAQLKMETYFYYVGANSSLQFNVLNTAVDDVIKAVRSAFKYGVVPGCQLSIIRACEELSSANDIGASMTPRARLREEIIGLIKRAVIDLYRTVLSGPDGSYLTDERFTRIFAESEEQFLTYDLELGHHSSDLITSVETDLNVLTAASELIKLLISGNQCVYLDSTLVNSEDIKV